MFKTVGQLLVMVTVISVLSSSPLPAQHPSVDISGVWQSNIGPVYEIGCSGNAFTWHVAGTAETAHGEIEGGALFATWTTPRGEQSALGQIVQADEHGRAVRIEWSNGVVFHRSFKAREPGPRAAGRDPGVAGREGVRITHKPRAPAKGITRKPRRAPVKVEARQEEGWCLLDREIFPVVAEDCRNAGGRFFPTWQEAEEFAGRRGAEHGVPPMEERHPEEGHRETARIDLAGDWFSNRGQRYLIEQNGLDFEVINLDERRAALGRVVEGRLVASPEGGGPELLGEIVEIDHEGRAHVLEWSDGIVLAREPFSGRLPKTGPSQAGTEPGGPDLIDISGMWTSSIKRTYTISQQEQEFTWAVNETDEKATGTIYGEEVVAEWQGGFGSGHAEGYITNRDAAGKALRIEWSNGVIFTRAPDQAKLAATAQKPQGTHTAVKVITPKIVAIPPAKLEKLIPHLTLSSVYDRWVKVGGPIGGLGYDVRYLANDANGRDVMFVTDNYSGVNKSVDGGKNWFASNDGIDARFGVSNDAIPVFSLTVDQNNPQIVWAGLKDVIGVYKSTDAGMSWTRKTPEIRENEFVFRGFTIMPGDSNTVFAAGELPTGVEGKIFGKVKGRIYATRDGGETWEEVWEGNDLARYVIIHPRNHNIMYASCGIFDREAFNSNCRALDSLPLESSWPARGGVGVLRSTDGGHTWQELNRNNGLTDLYVGSLVMHPTKAKIMLAGCGNNAASTYIENGKIHHTGGVFRTTDGGTTWTQTLKNDIITSVEFAPSNPDVAYASGRQRFYRSEDGGQTWHVVCGHTYPWGPPGVVAGHPIDILVDPVDPNTIFVNNYGGGNVMSRDGGKSWTIASQGYTGALMFDLSLHPENPDFLYAAARSGLFRSTRGGLGWKGLSYPPARLAETYSVAVHPRTPNIVLASQELGGTVYRSTDGGGAWQPVFRLPINPKEPVDAHGFKRIVFAPSAPRVVYAGACRGSNLLLKHPRSFGIYVSTQSGKAQSWREANSPLTRDKSVHDVAVHPKNHNIVYAATGEGLFKTTDGGGQWTSLGTFQRADQKPDKKPDVRAVALDPSNPNVVYVGIHYGGIWSSSDGGATWRNMSAGMDANEPVWAIVVNPADSKDMWAGSQRSGAFHWDTIEQQWVKVNEGLRTRAVVDMEIAPNGQILYAATTGEGVFRYHKRP